MNKALFNKEFTELIHDPYYAGDRHTHRWAQYIINNLHLLSNESLEYAVSVEGVSDCLWTSDVLEAFKKTLEERVVEQILLS